MAFTTSSSVTVLSKGFIYSPIDDCNDA